jgi:hypothetical protein
VKIHVAEGEQMNHENPENLLSHENPFSPLINRQCHVRHTKLAHEGQKQNGFTAQQVASNNLA